MYKTAGLFYPALEEPFVLVICLTVMGLSFWMMCDLFMDKIPQKRFMGNSFFVYAMHINVSAISAKLLYFVLPKAYFWAMPNFILTTLFTLISIEIFCVLLQKYLPAAYRVLSGERNASEPPRIEEKTGSF